MRQLNELISIFWQYFIELSKIPRESGSEYEAIQWIIALATKWEYTYHQDSFGNLIVQVPHNKESLAHVPCIALQSHLDMVCEKHISSSHDFLHDSLSLKIDDTGEWLCAEDTSLGADNGIAVAYSLALADPLSGISHGALELIFTREEETGLIGASHLDESLITSRYLINIDNFQEAMCAIGAAGGHDVIATLNLEWEEKNSAYSDCKILLSGLAGGHSGADIFDGRANALKILEHIYSECKTKGLDIRIAEIFGGDKLNAIPREAYLSCAVHSAQKNELKELILLLSQSYTSILVSQDRNFQVSIEYDNIQLDKVLTTSSEERCLQLIRLCPYGVLSKKSTSATGTTLSNNLSKIETTQDTMIFYCSPRYLKNFQATIIQNVLEEVFSAHCEVNTGNYYKPWNPLEQSKLGELYLAMYHKVTGKTPRIDTLHVGIECGVIVSKFEDDLDAICIGPRIEGAHSPYEKLHIQSAEQVFKVLVAMLHSQDSL